MNSYPRLLGDIGGTNARFALLPAPGEAFTAPLRLSTDDYPGPHEAIEHYLGLAGGARPRMAAIGIANPVTGDAVRMTNHHWAFSIEALRRSLGLERLWLLNDFTALALALPALQPHELVQVGGGAPESGAARALIGPGTGLGISGLFADDTVISGEGGHATLAALDEAEAAIIAALRRRHGHVSAERVLSGPGLESLYQAMAEIDGVTVDARSAAQITAGALQENDARCAAAVDRFCAFLGSVAGNLALTLGAFGGVYIGGGIVPRLGEHFVQSPFRTRFEAKGRFAEYLARIPAYVIHASYPALTGAARAIDRQLAPLRLDARR
jgi:glucokinase